MGPLQPLDAVITGCAYENATAALGVLEREPNTQAGLSPEMLCTLDNFIKVVLFSDRIFVTGCAALDDNHFVPREATYNAGEAGRVLFEKAQVFARITEIGGDSNSVEDRIVRTLHPVNLGEAPLFVIRCKLPKRELTILQEMVYLDAYFIEYAIEQFGAHRFKPIFPGEHLFLGLRRQRIPVPQATHTVADIPGRRVRTLVREKMENLNEPVSQGAPMLPSLVPMFVSRILHDRTQGSNLVQTLLEIRNSATMAKFRQWMVRYWKQSRSEDFVERTKAAEARKKLDHFTFQEDVSVMEFGKALLHFGKDVLKGDPLAIIEEIAPFVMKYLSGVPLSGLKEFGNANADPRKLQAFLKQNFGDEFNRNDLDSIATFLMLPEDLADWGKEEAEFAVEPRRLVAAAPPLSRPYTIQVTSPGYIANAKKDFDELVSRAERVTPEMLRRWEAESRKL